MQNAVEDMLVYTCCGYSESLTKGNWTNKQKRCISIL